MEKIRAQHVDLQTLQQIQHECNMPNFNIQLSLSEVEFIYKITGLGITRLWSENDKKLADGLNEFFRELLKEYVKQKEKSVIAKRKK